MILEQVLEKNWQEISISFPQLIEFLDGYGIDWQADKGSIGHTIDKTSDEYFEDIGIDRKSFLDNLHGFLKKLEQIAVAGKDSEIKSITLHGGRDKDGKPENFEINLIPGQISAIVGPTGSGKSRLLADIEWMASGDTPTGRRILINGVAPDPRLRFSLEHKVVAQLSQNMNFVLDATVEEFIIMHAESRMVNNSSIVEEVMAQANELAGEPFTAGTAVTALSGGQSRALMIADTAILSASPVVLIDEIENAGIDRKLALGLLVRKEKIILVATHDPILALMCCQRLVIKNGAVASIVKTSPLEQDNLARLERLDFVVQSLRQSIRAGQRVEELGSLDSFVAEDGRWRMKNMSTLSSVI
jgi:ABC-type lipoprotein export system ATPase subunit